MPPYPVLGRGLAAEARPKLGRREGAAVAVLLALLPVLAVAAVGNQQIFNAYLVWAERSADFRLFGREIPTTWLITLDTIASVSCLAGAVWFWRAWAKRLPEPDEVTKITLGCLISVTGFLALAAGAFIAQSSGSPVALGWLVTFHILNSIGFANIFPVGLALYSRAAPAAIAATIIGIYYLHLFAANSLVGWIGTLLERMPAVQFWLIHAGCSLAAGLVFLMVRRAAGQVLAPQS
jgi:proton-dependent oligopeptide transporter, POT family